MFERILVPLDGSLFGSRALKSAIEIARRFSAEIFLLQVVKPTTPVPSPMGIAGTAGPTAAEITVEAALAEDKRHTSEAKRYLSRKKRSISSRGIKTSHNVVIGEPADSIMKFARKKKVDLIVMSSHGKGGLKRAILGSVADEVVRKSGKPVLVVRPKTRKPK
jgi:nucleotide-binding universal stress UspA family protein